MRALIAMKSQLIGLILAILVTPAWATGGCIDEPLSAPSEVQNIFVGEVISKYSTLEEDVDGSAKFEVLVAKNLIGFADNNTVIVAAFDWEGSNDEYRKEVRNLYRHMDSDEHWAVTIAGSRTTADGDPICEYVPILRVGEKYFFVKSTSSKYQLVLPFPFENLEK